MEKTLQLKHTGMGGYQMEPVLSITSLPLSPRSYGKPSEDTRPSSVTPRKLYDGTFVQATIPLEEEAENRAITAWIHRGEPESERASPSHQIDTEYYGKGLHLMKRFGYKGNGPIVLNDKGLLKPIEATGRHQRDTMGLGFKKALFHLGLNKFITVSDSQPEP